jgi:hypothetical protein
MTDEANTETLKRGRPRGTSKVKPPPIRREPVHRGPHGGGEEPFHNPNYEFYPHEARDKFYIPKDITDAIERDWEQKLVWFALEIMGKPNEFLPGHRRNQWEEVRKGDFEGQFDHFGIKDGIVCVERVALFRQPIQITRKAVAYRERQAAAPIIGMRQKVSAQGVDNITMPGGAQHESALRHNRLKTTYEPGPKIPD